MSAVAEDTHDETCVVRTFCIERLRDDKTQEVTAYRVSLSSESPIKDWPWAPPNILVHEKSAIDLDGVAERGLPLFVNHDAYTLKSMVGRIVNVRLDKKRLVGDLKFSQANPDAAMVREMVDEGTLTDMSIRAEPMKIQRNEGSDGNTESVKWLRWRPIEASVVGIGADRNIGIGRHKPTSVSVSTTAVPAKLKEPSMADDTAAAGENADQTTTVARSAEVRVEAGRQEADKNFAAEQERRRQQAIRNLATSNSVGDDTVQNWISRGMSLDQVADDILAIHKERGKTAPRSISALGISDREAGQYSLCRAILAARDNDWRKAGFELECHRTIADKTDKPQQNNCFYVPLEVQRRQSSVNYAQLAERHGQMQWLQRDLNTSSLGAGGALVQTSVMGFDELLRNLSFAFRMGATRLTGLRDNVTIPRQSAAATAEWLTSETSAATESQPTFVQLAMTPKTVSAYTELSRKLLMQSSIDVEGLVNADLAAVAALAVDVAVISGTGASGQPLGIDNVTGVGTVSGTSLGLAGLLETQTDLATANVMPMRGGYVTTPAVAALMIAEVLYANTASPAWIGNVWNGTMLGYPAMSTNQVAAATMYFGAWENCVVGEWGVLEVDTNPYANFGAGIIGVRAMYSVDVGIRRPAAFTIASSIT
jgi:HK97 family phage major capsid protein/HK97 family phage prohead protease